MTTKTETLASAMAAAFAEIGGASKDKVNPHFKSKYADLGSVIDAIKPALVSRGLFYTQRCRPSEDGVIVDTVLHHASGEEMDLGSLYVPANKRDAQGFGSALTYARRYALMTAFGVPAEDDDGNAAVKSNNAKEHVQTSRDAPFAQGPGRNKTDLKTKGRDFWRDVEACGDSDELEVLLIGNSDLMNQIQAELPTWWSGGDKNGEPFDGLETIIARQRKAFADAQQASNYVNAG